MRAALAELVVLIVDAGSMYCLDRRSFHTDGLATETAPQSAIGLVNRPALYHLS